MNTFNEILEEARKGVSYKTHKILLETTARLYERMKEKKLNFSKLAKKLGVSRARISALFSCEHNVNLKTLVAVADALDCDLEIKLVPKEVSQQREQYKKFFSLPEEGGSIFSVTFDVVLEDTKAKDNEYDYASAS